MNYPSATPDHRRAMAMRARRRWRLLRRHPRRCPVASRSALSTIRPAPPAVRPQLREKGLAPRQRVEKGQILKGFWVYIGGLKSDGDVAEVLRTLEQSHIEDAHFMSDTGDVHRVSLGLFSERDRADRRAESVQKLGLPSGGRGAQVAGDAVLDGCGSAARSCRPDRAGTW